MRDRAWRRAQKERVRLKLRHRTLWMDSWGGKRPPEDWLALHVAKLERTRPACSCGVCGHTRYWYGPTRSELRAELPDLFPHRSTRSRRGPWLIMVSYREHPWTKWKRYASREGRDRALAAVRRNYVGVRDFMAVDLA